MSSELKAQQAERNLQSQTIRHALSPRVQLSLRLLGMPFAELSSYIDSQIVSNPFLSSADDLIVSGDSGASALYSSSVYSTALSEDIYIDEPLLEDVLLQQLHELDIPRYLEDATESLISQLDERGFLSVSSVRSAIDRQALDVLQSLSPAGIGARSLQECLKIQLNRCGESSYIALAIIDRYLAEVAERKYRIIAKNLGVSPKDVRKAVALISSLSPIPSRGYRTSKEPEIIQPEAYIELVDGILVIRMRKYVAFNERLLNSFGEAAMSANLEAERKTAQALVSMMDYRSNTIEKILYIVAGMQHDALIHGASQLKPLTMAEVADKLSLSPSTVTRAVQGKWIQAPCGLLKLRDCFASKASRKATHPNATAGEETLDPSAAHVRSLISELIRCEDHTCPLSDQDLLDALQHQGIHLSRRTIAKYRMELGIPSSKLRKDARKH
jgi:RNA polymerase sigma-54 factor